MKSIKENWQGSKTYRIFLIMAIVYAILRLAIQIFLFSDTLQPEAIAQGAQVSADLQESYVPAAQHFQAREDLYIKGSLDVIEAHYLYSPAFAFFFSPILLLPLNILVTLLVIIHIATYWLLYLWWDRIFQTNDLPKMAKMWARLLPFFLVFSAFWDDLAYMNTYLIVALLATFAIDSVMQEKLGPSVFWLAVILSIKPQWAFVAALPLLLGRYRFFFKMLAGTIIAYLLIAGTTILAGGISYGIQQYKDYFEFLSRLSRDFPWRGPEQPFLGYDHSITQIILYFLGVSLVNMRIATIVKLILLLPLGWVGLKFLRAPLGKPPREVPETSLALIFVLYLGAFIWLYNIWELSLGLVVLAYLLTTIKEKWGKVMLWVLFAPYALLDIWRLVSYIAWGDNILYQGAYVLTDPFIYIPWLMIILLACYTLLLKQLTGLVKNPV